MRAENDTEAVAKTTALLFSGKAKGKDSFLDGKFAGTSAPLL